MSNDSKRAIRPEILLLFKDREFCGMNGFIGTWHLPSYRRLVLLAGVILAATSCGYRVRSSIGRLPGDARSIGIPIFRNLTNQYKIEQLISSAVLKEFSIRTRSTVNSSNSGVDIVLLGEIHEVNSVPVIFGSQSTGSQTFGSAFLVTVKLGVKLMRLKDSVIVWQNNDIVFRERYVLNGKVRDFFSEENPAIERLARDFASNLASSVLNETTP
jgi:hypothetical protein